MSATMRCWQDLPPRPAWNEERHVRAMLASDTWATEFAAGMAEARAQGIRLVSHCVFDGRCEVFGTMTVAYFEILQKVLPIAIRGRVGRRMRCRRLRQSDPAVPMAALALSILRSYCWPAVAGRLSVFAFCSSADCCPVP